LKTVYSTKFKIAGQLSLLAVAALTTRVNVILHSEMCLRTGRIMRIIRLLSTGFMVIFLAGSARSETGVSYNSGKSAAAVEPSITSPTQINAVPHPISTNKPKRKYHKNPMKRPEAKIAVENYAAGNPRFILDRTVDAADKSENAYQPCRSFAGMNDTGWDPPDPHVAAGPNQIVEVVNSTIGIFDKTTGAVLLQSTGGFWFQNTSPPPPSGFIYDPKVVYDPNGGHFIILFLCTNDVNKSSYLVSVSQTSDAMGNWWSYNLDATLNGTTPANSWPDYPGLGFDFDQAVYVTSNQWEFNADFQYAKVRILPKFQLYNGAALSYQDLWDLKYNDNSTAFTVKPAVSYSDGGGEFLVSNLWYESNHTTYWKITNPVLSPVVTLKPQVSIVPYSSSPSVAQKLGANVGTLGSMTQDVVYRNGKVYTAFDQAFNWGSGTVAAIRVLGIDTASSLAVVDRIFGANGKHYYFPGIYVDPANRIFLGFNRSATDEYISIWYAEDLLATNSSRLLKAGTGPRSGGAPVRWGDYAGIAADPVDQNRVWMCTEYMGTVSANWLTWIGQAPSAVIQPALDSPDNGVTLRTPIDFSWDVFSPSAKYRLQVDDDSNFTSTNNDLTVDSNGVTVSGLNDQVKYYWRVAGVSDCPNNPWSSTRSFTACAFKPGDADGNGFINISDVVFLIGYIFSGGAAPMPLQAGDANCDAFVTISDAVFLINFIFSGGSAPCDPCS
jgi:hypothetical protein